MILCAEEGEWLCFAISVVPRASRTQIVGEREGVMRVRLAAPPVDGKANEELVRALAKFFDLPLRAIEIRSGHNSKRKRVCVAGVCRAAFEAKLQASKIA
ncbi:MAG: DUF167 domain-containing protein [Pyrinomonadaceae bacterium]